MRADFGRQTHKNGGLEMLERMHWVLRNRRTYARMLKQLEIDLPGKWVVVHNERLVDDGGPPFFDTFDHARGLAMKKEIIELALIERVPEQ